MSHSGSEKYENANQFQDDPFENSVIGQFSTEYAGAMAEIPHPPAPHLLNPNTNGHNPATETTQNTALVDSPKIIFDPLIARPNPELLSLIEPSPEVEEVIATPRQEEVQLARSSKTEEQYKIRVRGLYKASYNLRTTDPQFPVEPSPMDVIDDLVESVTPGPDGTPAKRSVASWRLYRAALLWHLAMNRHVHQTFEDAYQRLASLKYPEQITSKVTPRQKKTFKGSDFADLISTLGTLNRRKSTWGSRTAYWLQASVAAGARGTEWLKTSWLDREKLTLIIYNAKRKEADPAFKTMRANKDDPSIQSVHDLQVHQLRENLTSEEFGAASTLDQPILERDFGEDEEMLESDHISYDDSDPVDEVQDYRVVRINRNDAIYIDMHLMAIEAHYKEQHAAEGISAEEAFNRYKKMARHTLRNACDILFKGAKYYRLHDSRSQFSAERKTEHSIGAVASMMGHSSTRTTMSSYGSRHAGLKSKGLSQKNTHTQGQANSDQSIDADWFNNVSGGDSPAGTFESAGSSET